MRWIRTVVVLAVLTLLLPGSAWAGTVKATNVNFGRVPVGQEVERSVTFTNRTGEPVIVGGLSMTSQTGGFPPTGWRGTCRPLQSYYDPLLEPKASCTLIVVFRPLRPEQFRGVACLSAYLPDSSIYACGLLIGRGT